MTTKFQLPKEAAQAHLDQAEKRIDTKVQMLRDQGYRQDAISFSKSQLDQLEQTIYDVLYANPRDAFSLIPLNTSLRDGMQEWSYRMIEKLGLAKVVADGATDRPMIDADLTKSNVPVYEFGAGYTFTVGDSARSGAILDFDFVMEKARFAAESIALAHNEYAFVGGSGVDGGNSSITGFLNNATVVGNKPTLTDNDWTTVTGANAYLTIRDMITDVNAGSSGVHSATDVVLSTFCWNLVSGTLLDSTGSSQTVLSALRQNYPDVNFTRSASCNGRGTGGIDRNVAYQRSSANAEYVAGPVYDEASPDKAGFRYTVHSRGRSAGTVIRRPLSMVYGDITVA